MEEMHHQPLTWEFHHQDMHARSKSAATPQRSYLGNIANLSRDLEVAVVKVVNAKQDEEKAAGKPIAGIQDLDKLSGRLRTIWNDADRGIPRSQFTLGGYYHLGGATGIEIDLLQALKWYARAASSGDIASINNIGVMLMKGLGLPQDEAAAIKWLEYAAEQGNVYSMVNLGILLTKPTDMKCQDFNRAYELYYKAAKMGNTIAQNNLGCMLARGYGCEKDDKKAMKYFKRSSEGGSAAAKYNVGVLHQNGWGVKADFEKAKDWFDAAAADPKHDEYPYVIADNGPTKFLLLTSIISYKP
jgi:TPR repeat protein